MTVIFLFVAPLFLQTADFQERGRRDVEQLTAWIETLELNDMLGMIQLDRRVFGAKPRLDILHRIVLWQRAKRRSVGDTCMCTN